MSKRVRITAIVATLCVCLSLFVVGVLSATTATLNVTSTLRFEADGVYVMVDASLKQGADVGSATVLSGEGEPTGQATYTAYSYKKTTDSNAPDGSASSDTFLQADGTTPAGDWAIGDIYFTSQNIVVVYEFMVYNYSEFEVTGTVTGVSEALASHTDKLSVTTYTGTTSADAIHTNTTYTFNIPARTSTTEPGQACYKIAITLNRFIDSFETNQINMGVNFEKAPEPVYDYFTYSGDAITGFSDTYLNLETKPETLVIPSTDGEGNNIIFIVSGSFSTSTFQGLESSKLIIQEGITSIGDFAFKNCNTLTSVSLPSTLTSIGDMSFYECMGLTGELVIPEGVTSIESSAFASCMGLTGELVIPEGVTSLVDSVFSGCSGLTGKLVIPEGVTSIERNAFFGCSSLTSVSLPSTLTSIGSGVFSNCSGLTGELVIPNGVTSIGDSAFYGCSSLTSISLPSTLTSIGSSAFNGCTNLTNITIPSSVTSIGRYAFSTCTNLTRLTINTQAGYVWQKASSSSSSANWTNVNVSIPEQNATWFKRTSGYYNYYWRQVAQ